MPHLFHPRAALVSLMIAGSSPSQLHAAPDVPVKICNTLDSTVFTATGQSDHAPVVFRLDWVHGSLSPDGFKNLPGANGKLSSVYKIGETTITRTILKSAAEECIFIHIHADQPGPVHFTARFLSEDPVEIRDRRQLYLPGEETDAQAWIIPYESDVNDDGETITLAGEGEALIILKFSQFSSKKNLEDIFARLGRKYDPGHTPPSPHLIWSGVAGENGK